MWEAYAIIGPMILLAIFAVWMFADCATNTKLEDDQKIICLVLIFFTGPFGGFVYWMMYKNRN
ncbi:MAG: PLDc N-terminal domain-containing protein [Planctomycetes bacterium]|nr:PLDc N-terminal domain-containing protein [Planctomycetota bacterium]